MSEVLFDALYARKVFRDVHNAFWRGKYSEYWLKGGRGSTKSCFISLEIVAGMMADPQANAIIYRRFGNTLKDSVYNQMIWAIDMMQLDYLFRTKLSPLEIINRRTGQRIMFRGTDDPQKSKSIKLTRGYFKFLWFEELSEFRGMEDIRTIQQSIFRNVDRACTFYSYNPPRSAQNWVNAEALVPVPGRMVHHSTYLDVPREWLGEAFIAGAEALKAVNERAYENEYMGAVTGTGGQVFDNLEIRKITDAEIETMGRFYNGLDFGFATDPDALTRWAYDRRACRLYAIAEFYGVRNNTDVLADRVKHLVGRELVYCDSAEPRMINELKRRGINAIPARKGPGSVEHGMRWLQDLAAIVIDPKRTPNIAREFSEYEYAQDRLGQFLAAYPDRDNHTIDATRYGMEVEANFRKATTRSDIY